MLEVHDELVGEDHPARLLWDVLGEYDLTRSAEGATGRSVLSPRMKATLWLFAIADGGGAPSFRAWGSPLECRAQAELHLEAVLTQGDDPELSKAQKARRVSAAKDYLRRVEEAIAACKEQREQRPESVARGSTTDAEARVMKMADGGFRPA